MEAKLIKIIRSTYQTTKTWQCLQYRNIWNIHITEFKNSTQLIYNISWKVNCCNVMAVLNPENMHCEHKLYKLGFP